MAREIIKLIHDWDICGRSASPNMEQISILESEGLEWRTIVGKGYCLWFSV